MRQLLVRYLHSMPRKAANDAIAIDRDAVSLIFGDFD